MFCRNIVSAFCVSPLALLGSGLSPQGTEYKELPHTGELPTEPAEPVAFKSKAGDDLGLSLISLCDIKIAGNWPMCTCVCTCVRV